MLNSSRPVVAGILSLLSGIFILGVGLMLMSLSFMPGSLSYLGLLEGMVMCTLALLLLAYPQFSGILGAFIIVLAIFSIIGTLGGLVLGTIFGMAGGTLAVAWKGPVTEESMVLSSDEDQSVLEA